MFLPRQIEEVEQGLLVIGDAIGILYHERRPLTDRIDEVDVEIHRVERRRARQRLPHTYEVSLAARRRSDQELDAVVPFRPRIDQSNGGEIAVADQKIFRAERSARGLGLRDGRTA